jgi:hypothetical protein
VNEVFFSVPFLSLGIVLIALAMMAPVHKLSWLWRTACSVAAVPPILAGLTVGSSEGSTGEFLFALLTVSLVASAPFAAVMSLAVAFRLRGVA